MAIISALKRYNILCYENYRCSSLPWSILLSTCKITFEKAFAEEGMITAMKCRATLEGFILIEVVLNLGTTRGDASDDLR